MSDSAKRLAVQPGTSRTLVLEDLPRIPESMIRRFPELREYDEAIQRVGKKNANAIREFIAASLAQTP